MGSVAEPEVLECADGSVTDSPGTGGSLTDGPGADSVPNLRRSERVKAAPDRLGEWVCNVSTCEPGSYSEAVVSNDCNLWLKAMNNEIALMEKNKVFELVKPPDGAKIIGNRWVFKVKSGGVHRARLVACGYSQTYGIDYEETFSPVIGFDCIRTIIALSSQLGFSLYQMDITGAFLNGTLDRELFMYQPEGFVGDETIGLEIAEGNLWLETVFMLLERLY